MAIPDQRPMIAALHAAARVPRSDAIQEDLTMFIVVEHAITSPEVFFRLVPKVTETPAGIKAIQFLPSVSQDRAACLWQAKSVDALKSFLEPLIAQSSRNIYYAVDSRKSIGLPTLALAA
jgi:hypothetical protein